MDGSGVAQRAEYACSNFGTGDYDSGGFIRLGTASLGRSTSPEQRRRQQQPFLELGRIRSAHVRAPSAGSRAARAGATIGSGCSTGAPSGPLDRVGCHSSGSTATHTIFVFRRFRICRDATRRRIGQQSFVPRANRTSSRKRSARGDHVANGG